MSDSGIGITLIILLIGFLLFPQEIGVQAAKVKQGYDAQITNPSSKAPNE